MRESQEGDLAGSRRALLKALDAGPAADIDALLGHARRLGFDLSQGAVAICAHRAAGVGDELPTDSAALLAQVSDARVLGLVPPSSTPGGDGDAEKLAAALAALGMEVAVSAPRRDPAALHEALREAELMVELAISGDAALSGQEETYRLLIGVLLRDPEELEQLRTRTIAPLIDYDTHHETDLLATLQAFLAHHGSTTETAEAMSLHRHTVGYRLARVHEVSGLSPYESDGRERLSLGLKAHQILAADERRVQGFQPE
jgi:sugar diacid utilization regulator